MPGSNPLALRAPLEAVMREAGDLARAIERGGYKHWTKGDDNSPVTEGDIAVNDLLRTRLSNLVPGAGWLSEETEDLPDGSLPLAWVVDPIDGTRAYISGRADWTISVALVENGRPVLAALFAPVTDEMFLAARGAGAVLNGAAIAASCGGTLERAKLAGPKRYLEKLAGLDPTILAQPKVHSLALRLARVAHGDLDAACVSPGSHDWDLAAADLLVHEAGGAVDRFCRPSAAILCPARRAWRADRRRVRPPRHADRSGARPPRRVCINPACGLIHGTPCASCSPSHKCAISSPAALPVRFRPPGWGWRVEQVLMPSFKRIVTSPVFRAPLQRRERGICGWSGVAAARSLSRRRSMKACKCRRSSRCGTASIS